MSILRKCERMFCGFNIQEIEVVLISKYN